MAALTLTATVGARADVIDNDSNASILATQAKSLVQRTTRDGPTDQGNRLRDARGSQIATHHREADCGGVAIGNVRPSPHDHARHETNVIIRGNVINTNNRC
jgi:hypothetical protein